MCGIFGFANRYPHKSSLIDNSKISYESLQRRGPDNTTFWTDGRVGLLHSRLAVIDTLETSNQPIFSKDKKFGIICNGEIYNYCQLRQELKKEYNFQSTSDIEVILALYITKGIEGINSCRGTFSFAIYDCCLNKLILYRDPIGKKPLFFYWDDNSFIFSSSVSTIFQNLVKKPNLNKFALDSYFKYEFILPWVSIFEQITPVFPAQCIELNLNNFQIIKRMIKKISVYDGAISSIKNELDSFNIIKHALNESFNMRVEGLKYPVLLFSGGIDTTILASLMKQYGKGHLITLGALIPGTYDEIYAWYAGKKLALKYTTVRPNPFSLFSDCIKYIQLQDEPFSAYSFVLLAILSKEAKKYGNVLFTGDGGDETFYGYNKDLIGWTESTNNKFPINPEFTCGPDIPVWLNNWGRFVITTYLVGHGFVKVDRATSEQQVEARCPFVDYDLMYVMRSLPLIYISRKKISKPVLKEFLSSWPRFFLERKKIGFAYNFRYALILHYKKITQYISPNVVEFLNNIYFNDCLSLKELTGGYRTFKRFDFVWKLFVLSVFLKKNKLV